jgi:septum formation topological specificity factor MinE
MENLTDEDVFSDNESEIDIIENETKEPEEKIDLEVIRTLKIPKKTTQIEKPQETRTLKIPLKKKIEPAKEEKLTDEILKLAKKYVKKQPNTVEEWAKARASKTKLQEVFGYTQDGDLEVGRVLEGDQKKIIVLPEYKEASAQYIQGKINERKEEIKKAEEEYMNAKRNLQKVMQDYLASEKSGVDISEVLRANQEVHDKECSLNTVAKYPRTISGYSYKLKESDLTLNAHDEKTIVDPVMSVEYSYFSPDNLFMLKQEESTLNLEDSPTNSENINDNSNSNNSSMSGGKKPLSMAAIMAIKARNAARRY